MAFESPKSIPDVLCTKQKEAGSTMSKTIMPRNSSQIMNVIFFFSFFTKQAKE